MRQPDGRTDLSIHNKDRKFTQQVIKDVKGNPLKEFYEGLDGRKETLVYRYGPKGKLAGKVWKGHLKCLPTQIQR